jgi:hypothetical protein
LNDAKAIEVVAADQLKQRMHQYDTTLLKVWLNPKH